MAEVTVSWRYCGVQYSVLVVKSDALTINNSGFFLISIIVGLLLELQYSTVVQLRHWQIIGTPLAPSNNI